MAFPHLSGIPPLFGKVVVAAVTLGSGLLQNLLDKFLPVWEIIGFTKAGSVYTAVKPDNFISLEYSETHNISNYPIEQGQFATYNKVKNPNTAILKVSVGGSEIKKSRFLDDVDLMSKSLNEFWVLSPSGVYRNLTVERYEYKREVSNGVGVLAVTIHFTEIMSAVIAATAAAPKNPAAEKQVNS